MKMKPLKRLYAALLAAVIAFAPAVSRADVILSLQTSFVKKHKDRATVTTEMFVDHFHKSPNSIVKDGDIHIAGRDSVIRLPLVIEIMNGALMKAARESLLLTSPEQAVPVTGVWRLWFEHPGSDSQFQGRPVPVPKNTGPDHLFEIHPVTSFAGVDVLQSFVDIKSEKADFRGKDARTAFAHYESRQALMWSSDTAIMIETSRAFHNYTEFVMELAGKPKKVADGFIVLADVYAVDDDAEEPLVPKKIRMIFAEGTPAADKVSGLAKGARLHVLGIPRVNLSEVFALAIKRGEKGVKEKLPYEMIIAAVYDPEEE
jgi:hypothetical protein